MTEGLAEFKDADGNPIFSEDTGINFDALSAQSDTLEEKQGNGSQAWQK